MGKSKKKKKARDQEMPGADGVKVPMTLQRRTQIAQLVQGRGAVRVAELAEHFQVSEVTIRTDLNELEKNGHLTRDHGGAITAQSRSSQPLTSLAGIEQRAVLNLEAKRRIGREAATRVGPGDTILLDAGTTVVQMVPHLAGIPDLTVVTHALNVALELGALTTARIILLGGTFNRESCSALGPAAEATLQELIVQKLFLGAQAIDAEHGLTDTTPEISQIKQAMIQAAREVVLLTDSSKWLRAGFIKVAPLSDVGTLISDSELDGEARAAFERSGAAITLV